MSEEAKPKATETKETREPRPAGGETRREGGEERRPQRRPQRRFQRRRKFCKFCADKSLTIDHKDPELLRQFITDRYKILPSRVTGTCAAHQRTLTTAVKRARLLALLAYTPLHHG
jgi:small subunit ribosomal protein S18